MGTKIANEYSTDTQHAENIVPLDSDTLIGNLQNYLERERKKTLINQANHYLKRLSLLREMIAVIHEKSDAEGIARYDTKNLIETIDRNVELIKNDEKLDSFSKNLTQVAIVLSSMEQKVIAYSTDISDELQVLRKETHASFSEIKQQAETIAHLKDEIHSLNASFAISDRELKVAKQEAEQAKENLKKREQNTGMLHTKLSELSQDANTLRHQLAEKEIALKESNYALDKYEKEHEERMSEMFAMEISLNAIKEKYHEMRTKARQLEQEADHFKTLIEGDALNIKVQEAEHRIGELERSLKRQEAIATSKTQESETLRRELNEQGAELKSLKEERAFLKEDIAKKQQKFEKGKAAANDTLYQMEMAKRGLDKANDRIEMLDNELETTKEQLRQKEVELQHLSRTKNDTQDKHKALFYVASSIAVALGIALVTIVLK